MNPETVIVRDPETGRYVVAQIRNHIDEIPVYIMHTDLVYEKIEDATRGAKQLRARLFTTKSIPASKP